MGWIILIAFVLLIAVILLRAIMLKPTSAKNTIQLEQNDRANKYGKQLSRMIQDETISSRFEQDRSKFYQFHHTLEELFPNVHATCEKHDFNGNLLY